jgi:hypothetical protein
MDPTAGLDNVEGKPKNEFQKYACLPSIGKLTLVESILVASDLRILSRALVRLFN